ncbi:MFS transporter [Ktedonobacter sp. SOSP1-52]|nr:MFS transporter [Ktedonobacter sp. SOSP1-52]
MLALQLTAVLTLHANAAQLGLLGAAEYAPLLLLSLFAGVWVDRLPRRLLLLISDIGQAALMGSVPVAFLLGLLRIEYLYAVAFLAGCFAVVFGVAYQSFLPELVKGEDLLEGNSKLEASRAVDEIAGPSLAGVIVQVLSAPLALFIDAASFLMSAICLKWIRIQAAPMASKERPSIWKQIAEGLQTILKHPLLRAIAAYSSTLNFCWSIISTVYTLYAVNELHLSSTLLGIALGVGSLGGLLGAMIAERFARWRGLGPALLATALLASAGALLTPLAHGPLLVALSMLIAGRFLEGISATIYNVNQISLRQSTTPTTLQGRVNATIRFLAGGSAPLGSLVGGLLGTLVGVRPTLLLGAIGVSLAFGWLFFSPIRQLR